MSVGIDISAPELELLQKRLLAMSRVNFTGMLEGIGGIVESQTRRRIQSEKTDPAGKPWDEWSEDYAASKHGATKSHKPHPGRLTSSGKHTILSLDGGLYDSLQFAVNFDELEIGSNLKYARRQNAQRKFLGLSTQNTADVMESINDVLDELTRPLQ